MKLAPGAQGFSDFRDRLQGRAMDDAGIGRHVRVFTRNTPKAADDVLDGGAIYWVIKGQIMARTPVLHLESGFREDGRPLCIISVSADPVGVVPVPRRPFQGWRYLKPDDAPEDLPDGGDGMSEAPPEMLRELQDLKLI
ncbi:DUF1489 family protein [Yunchengibacter salinarum]|uniref:DUF1489 family protein n=1 Tax=Yunchengibacter salinarum TaxID=3133399 RepID=UPI0035B589EA